MEDLAGAQIKMTKLMVEANKKRDKLFLKHKADEPQRTREYKAEEASKNQEHELRLAQIYASVRPTSGISGIYPIGHICKIYLEIVKTYKQMSLGNVNICLTIIFNCDSPRSYRGAPQKLKGNMAKKRHISLLFLCIYAYVHVLIYVAAFFVILLK